MEIQITKTAIKDIKKLDKPTRDRLLEGINKLPLGDVKRLQGYINYYRLRKCGMVVVTTAKFVNKERTKKKHCKPLRNTVFFGCLFN